MRFAALAPHWLIVDEAHHFLPTLAQPAQESLPADLGGVAAVTVRPRELARPFLERLEAALGVGPHAEETIAEFCAVRGLPKPRSVRRRMRRAKAFLWREGQDSLLWVRLARTRAP